MKSRTHLKRKQVDDVLGGDDSWGNQTQGKFVNHPLNLKLTWIAPCPKCDHPMAHFMELQIRSADEPMTICTSSNFSNSTFTNVSSLQMR